MRAAIYTRISNDPKLEHHGVERQLEDCLSLAKLLGAKVVRTFEDNDLSAYRAGVVRPDFEALLSEAGNGAFDLVICWHFDRFVRTRRDFERVVAAAMKGRLRAVKGVHSGELDLSTAAGQMMGSMLTTVAQYESQHHSERRVHANVQRAEAGGWWSSNRCFGYTQDGEVLDVEATFIRQAAADVLDGKSLRQIAREWNACGVTSTQGTTWNTSRIKRVLVNPRYAALRVYRGKVTGPGDWQAIVDPETHAGLLAVLRDVSRGGAVSYERKFLGSHRYRCGICGAPLQHTVSTHSSGKTFHRYACTQAAHLSRTQPELDAYVERVVLTYLRGNPKLHERLAADRAAGVDVAELRERRAALAAQKDELATLFTDGVLDGPSVRRESAKLQGKLSAIDAELAELARTNPAAKLLEDGLEELEARWAELSPDLKGKVVDEVCTVTVNPSPRGRYFKPECIDIQPRT